MHEGVTNSISSPRFGASALGFVPLRYLIEYRSEMTLHDAHHHHGYMGGHLPIVSYNPDMPCNVSNPASALLCKDARSCNLRKSPVQPGKETPSPEVLQCKRSNFRAFELTGNNPNTCLYLLRCGASIVDYGWPPPDKDQSIRYFSCCEVKSASGAAAAMLSL